MNIAIIGVGGVGGYFGAKLCRGAPGANVSFVARGSHLEAIKRSGLTVRTSSEGTFTCRPALATADIEALPVLDVCLVCVKSYDLAGAMKRLARRVKETTEIVPLLNGVDVYERIRDYLHTARVFPACVFIGTHIAAPGTVEQQGGACKILFGRDPRDRAACPSLTKDLFEKSAVSHEWHDDIYPSIWSKYIFIAAFGLVTACFGKTLGQVMESSALSDHVMAVMREALELAKRQGVALPDTIVTDSYRKGRDFPFDTKTSFQRDVDVAGKPDERDLFGGTILRLGTQLSVPTPATEELWEMLNMKKPSGE
jgi:2-dehydropantoate 2-reductase